VIKDVQSGKGLLKPGYLLAMDPTGTAPAISGDETTEPTFGLPARWIEERTREEASFNGYTVVDCSTVITTHLTEVIKDNLADLLTRTETQKLLDELTGEHKKLVAELVPSQISMASLQKVLQNLLSERISIRDLPTILEAMADAIAVTRNIVTITEMVRARLSRQISSMYATGENSVPVVALSAAWEKEISESIRANGDDRQLAMDPTKVQAFLKSLRDTFEKQLVAGVQPVLMTGSNVRPFVRSLTERPLPSIPIVSQAEIHTKVKIKTVATV
jgi:flagellar biosynthesis protein FlhA